MTRRLFTLASAASVLLLVAVLVLWARSRQKYGANPVLTLRNHTLWADNVELSIGTPRRVGWSVGYVWIEVALSVLPLVWIALFLRRKVAEPGAQGRCRTCGYDLRASVGRCPEC